MVNQRSSQELYMLTKWAEKTAMAQAPRPRRCVGITWDHGAQEQANGTLRHWWDSLSKVSVAFSQTRWFILQLFWVFLTLTFTSSSHLMHFIQYHGKHPNYKAWNCWSCLVQTKQASQVYYEFALLATPQLAVTQRMSVSALCHYLFHRGKSGQRKEKKDKSLHEKTHLFQS